MGKNLEVIDYTPQMLGDRVLIRPLAAQKRGLIELPETTQTQEGEVIAVGPGRVLDSGVVVPISVYTGQRVIYGRYSGHEIEINGERLWSMRESEIHCVLRSKKSLDN